ncbi:MAG: glycosyltransferase family 2 protein [Aggregatilineales bacterium]
MTIAAIILTKNEAAHIADCIHSVAWADRVVVYDSGSSDHTCDLARAAGAEVLTHPWLNYADQREAALQAVSDEWVFFVDADERSSPEQATEIRSKIANPDIHGYWVPRHNYIMGKLTRHAGWYPDYQLRVLRRVRAHYDLTRAVHELVILDGKADYLQTPLVHYNYRDLAQFLEKQNRYTDYAAQQLYQQRVRVKPQNFVLQPLRQFWWRFVTLNGYRDGLHGLRLSTLMAWYEFQKYVRLGRAWRTSGASLMPRAR